MNRTELCPIGACVLPWKSKGGRKNGWLFNHLGPTFVTGVSLPNFLSLTLLPLAGRREARRLPVVTGCGPRDLWGCMYEERERVNE